MPNWVINKVKFSDKGKEILDKIIKTSEHTLNSLVLQS